MSGFRPDWDSNRLKDVADIISQPFIHLRNRPRLRAIVNLNIAINLKNRLGGDTGEAL